VRSVKEVLQPAAFRNDVAVLCGGTNANIGMDQVAKSEPDGYTLVVADPTTSLPANVTLFPNLKFHPVRDLAPVAGFGFTRAAVIVTDSLPAKTFQEFVALARSKPRQLLYGSTGNGSRGHLNGELLSRLVGVETVHVPYRNGAQGTTDLLTGRIHFWVAPIPTRLNEIREGRLRALAVAGNERSSDLPDIPTVSEAGFGPFDDSTAYAVFAPKSVPEAILQRLHSEIGGSPSQRTGVAETSRGRCRTSAVRPPRNHAFACRRDRSMGSDHKVCRN
jgi:tripartite-type tricarboxylate transporter receptor subunit TctC